MAAPDRSARPFVGRTAEREAFGAQVAAARDGNGCVVLVAGDPGIGKTRLVEETTAGLPRTRVLWGRCHETEGAPAFWPWMQVLRTYVNAAPADLLRTQVGSVGAEVARIVPALRARCPDVGDLDAARDDPEAVRFRLFDAVATFLRAVARDELLVLVLDDLHWADSESLLLLTFLAREIRDVRLLVVGTYREVEMRQAAAVPRILGDLARTSHRVALIGLAVLDVARYVTAAAGHQVPEEVVHAIHRATEGNAYFVTEVVQLLRAEGRLDSPAALRSRIELPDGVRDVIRRRVDPLPDPTRRLLEAASVLGRELDLAVLAHVMGADVPAIFEGLSPALALGAMTLVADSPRRVRFAHALLQETLVADLGAGTRADLHRRAGEALEAVHADALDPILGEIAHHYFEAAPLGTLGKAIERASLAGFRAYARLGYEEAAGHFERALQASRAGGVAADRRLSLLIAFAQAQEAAGDDGGARATLIEAAQLARDLDDSFAFGRVAMLIGAAAATGTVDAAIIGLLEEAVRRAGARDGLARVFLLGQLSRALYFADADRRNACSAEALAIARRLGDAYALHTALQARHFALWEPGTVEERRALGTESIALLRQVGVPLTFAEEYSWRILDHLEIGDMAVVDDTLRRYRALAARWRLPRVQWHVTVVEAALAQLAGRLDEAERLAVGAARIRPPNPGNNVAPFMGVQLYLVREEQGRLAELAPAVSTAARDATTLPIWQVALAHMRATLGDPEAARHAIAGMAARGFSDLPRDGNRLGSWARLAETCALLGETAWAEALLPLLAPHAHLVVVLATTVGCLGSVARYVGLLARTIGRLDEAVASFDAALVMNERIGALPQLARTQHDLACTLRARGAPGDVARAAALDDEAGATATRLGLAALAARLSGTSPATTRAPQARVEVDVRTATLRREGDVWTIACGTELTRVKDTKGVGYLAQLLRNPGREFHAHDLGGTDELRSGDAGEMLDADARRAYKARLEAVRDELAEAEELADRGRIERLRDEMEMLADELTRASGLGGRARRASSDAERARLNVTRAIRAVVKKVMSDCPTLGGHLDRSVRTGLFCTYEPDPAFPLRWEP